MPHSPNYNLELEKSKVKDFPLKCCPSVSSSCARPLIAAAVALAADVVDMIIIMVVAGTIPFANIIPCHVIKIWHPKSAHYAHFPHLFLGKSFMKCQKVCMQNISTLLGLTEGRVGSSSRFLQSSLFIQKQTFTQVQ